MTHWIVTEPTRGMSLRIDVPKDADPDDMLAKEFPREHEAYLAHFDDEPDSVLEFKEWLEGERYTVQFVS